MTQERAEKLAKYFTKEAVPCDKDGRQAVCRSVTAGPYTLEEVVFSEGSITRYDLSENLNFYGGGTRTATIEQGEVVAVTGCTGYVEQGAENGFAGQQLLEPITPLRERHAAFMVRNFTKAMREHVAV